MNKVRFGSLFQVPLRNGVYVKSDLHGAGTKIVNMGELFSFPFVSNQPMSRVQLSDSEKATSLLEDGDLLFGRRSLVESGAGKCAVVICPSEPLTFESSVIRVRLDKMKAYPLFYYYWFKSPIGQATIRTLVTGSNVKGIKGSELKEIVVDCPSIEIQKKIANTLFLLDKKIEANNTLSSKLESLASLIYDYWFLQFEFPNEEGEPYRSSGGKMAWNEELKRDIPEGWENGTIRKYVSRITNGLNPRKNFTLGYGCNYYVTTKNLDNEGNIDFTTCDYISDDALTKINNRSDLQIGDVLFSGIATVGRVYLITEKPQKWNINEAIFALRPAKGVSSYFLYNFFQSEEIQKQADLNAIGSSQRCLTQDHFLDIPCLYIPNNVQIMFEHKIKPIMDMRKMIENENRTLVSFRDFHLPLFMNGQVTFKDDKEKAPLEE